MSCSIDATAFKDFFDRGEFQYGPLPFVRDKDIDAAIAEAEAVFNFSLYPDEETCQQALTYLAGHFLVLDQKAASGGAATAFMQQSRSVGGVSESLTVPTWMQSGEFAFYNTTYYGQKFLILSKPYMDGAVYSVSGGTSY